MIHKINSCITTAQNIIMLASSNTAGRGYALFAAGVTTSGSHKSTCKYTFSSNISSLGASLSGPHTYGAACGNSTVALVAGSANSNLKETETYDYHTNAIGAYLALHKGKHQLAAVSTSAFGYFAGGTLSGYEDVVAVVDRMDFIGDTVATAKNIYLALTALSVVGNKTMALFGGGMTKQKSMVSSTYKLEYASDTRAPGAQLPMKAIGWATASNGSIGLFACGTGSGGVGTPSMSKYDFTNDSMATGTNLSTAKGWVTGTGNATFALFGGGKSASTSTAISKMDRYEYGTGALSHGTNLNCGRMYHAASCDSHGGL